MVTIETPPTTTTPHSQATNNNQLPLHTRTAALWAQWRFLNGAAKVCVVFHPVATADYNFETKTVSFPVNVIDTQKQCFQITILQDTEIEGTESFTISLSSVNPQIPLLYDEASVTIKDDDGGM